MFRRFNLRHLIPAALDTSRRLLFFDRSANSNRASIFASDGAAAGFLHIGDVRIALSQGRQQSPQNVPAVLPSACQTLFPLTQETLAQIRWMAQKEALGQDICIVGEPGPTRRWLALTYCHYAKREVQHLCLSRDTTEADIKQRKEIEGGSLLYVNQAAVTAAINGQVLIIEGLERAERNVLPVINNLLENREMHLDNGMMLVHPDRYDQLLRQHQTTDLLHLGLLRTSEHFRVIGLTVPVPKYAGNPLDPPLRSRFQCLYLPPAAAAAPFQIPATLQKLLTHALSDPILKLRAVLSATDEAGKLGDRPQKMPPLGSFETLLFFQQLSILRNENPGVILHKVYPWQLLAKRGAPKGPEGNAMALELAALLTKYGFGSGPKSTAVRCLLHAVSAHPTEPSKCLISFSTNDVVEAPCGTFFTPTDSFGSPAYVATARPSHFLSKTHKSILAQMAQSHCAKRHFCLIGASGIGKTVMAREFSSLFGYKMELMQLYSDMTSRDLLQRRTTNAQTGSTTWELSGLMRAALHGSVVVLDGIDHLPQGALSQLQQLFVDGTITLFDGSIFKSYDEFHILMNELGETPSGMAERRVHCIHPNFRVIATARPPTEASNGKGKYWLQTELPTMLDIIQVEDFDSATTTNVLEEIAAKFSAGSSVTPAAVTALATALVSLQSKLQQRRAVDPKIPQLSLRQQIHIVKLYLRYPMDIVATVESALLLPLLSSVTAAPIREMVLSLLSPFQQAPAASLPSRLSIVMASVIKPKSPTQIEKEVLVVALESAEGGKTPRRGLFIRGQPVMWLSRQYSESEKAIIPHMGAFFANPQHDSVLCWLAKQYASNSNILLVGNQGVGKNKVVDQFLSFAGVPRHYLQLHRDTTVASLTLNPSVINGQVVWQDSPLIKAVSLGHTLVVDEIDKAPVEVIQVLKGLVEDREMVLGDGRIIREKSSSAASRSGGQSIIDIHPDFRIIVLANPPGYPFHGNDFYRECGDVFACFVLGNPDASSQELLLRKYGPNVPGPVITQLIQFFGELQTLFNEGAIQYPFSLREMIAIVKHLQGYPQDGLIQALNNVFCFDAADVHVMDHVRRLIHKYFRKTLALRKALSVEEDLVRQAPGGDGGGLTPLDLAPERAVPILVNVVDAAATSSEIELAAEVADVPIAKDALTAHEKEAFSELQGRSQLDFLLDGDEVLSVATLNSGVTSLLVRRVVPEKAPQLVLMTIATPGVAQRVGSSEQPLLPSGVVTYINLSSVLATVPPPSLFALEQNSAGVVLLGLSAGSSCPSLLAINNVSTPASIGDLLEFPVKTQSLSTCVVCANLCSSGLVALIDTSNAPNIIHCMFYGVLLRITVPFAVAGIRFFASQLAHVTDTAGKSFLLKLDVLFNVAKGTLHPLPPQLSNMVLAGKSSLETGTTAQPVSTASMQGAFTMGTGENSSSVSFFEAGQKNADSLELVTYTIPDAAGALQSPVVDHHRHQIMSSSSGALSVVNTQRKTVRRISNKTASPNSIQSTSTQGISSIFDRSSKVLSTFDMDSERLEKQYQAWSTVMDGKGSELGSPPTPKELNMWYSKPRKAPSGTLKHGEEDPENTPHVGGNNWAGGTGGTDTAGLGGLVGPYRLDKGHPVHQVSPEDKKKVPQHIIDEAKRMGRQALEERLKEIGLSKEDNERYAECLERITGQAEQLRLMLNGLKAKEGERVWMKHQTDGVWDDAKLVDGIVGEKNIYKRRVDDDMDKSFQQKHKKRLLFLVDVSASMYRFNGMDGRLSRLIESTVMVMEALVGHEDKIDYAVIGHSGDSEYIPFVDFGTPPADRRKRLEVLLRMSAHAQHCWSGDHTVDGMKRAIAEVTKEAGDSYFVFVVSDANLSQYNISPQELTRIIRSDERVQMFCIFIASLGQQSSYIQARLPPGHGFECFDAKQLPLILKQIFVSTDLLGH